MRLLLIAVFAFAVTELLLAEPSRAGDQEKGQLIGNKPVVDDKKDPPKGVEPKKNPDEPEPITIKAKITKDDPLDSNRQKCHYKVHTVKLAAGLNYIIDMKAEPKKDTDEPSFDTYLRLEDSTGKELAENDDYITTDSRIVFTPDKAGEFRVICTTFDPGFTGSYTLTVTGYKGGLKKGEPVVILNLNALLTKNEPLDDKRQGSHAKVHLFKMLPNKTYQIDMITPQFDAYLRLEDSKGVELAEDDDSGGGLNARIIFSPTKADDFRIIATSFGPNATGMYQLKISQLK